MRTAWWIAGALALAACGREEPRAEFAITSGTYQVTSSQVVADGCQAAEAYGAVGRTFNVTVTGDPRAWIRDAAFDLDGTTDRTTWVTGTFRFSNMGTSEGGRTYAAVGPCVVLIGRSMAVDLTGDDRLFMQLAVSQFQAPFSPADCRAEDFPAGVTVPHCVTSLRLEAERR